MSRKKQLKFSHAAKPAVATLAMSLALSGCMSMAPRYERPAAPVAANFPALPAEAGVNPPSVSATPAADIGGQGGGGAARGRRGGGRAGRGSRGRRGAGRGSERARARY